MANNNAHAAPLRSFRLVKTANASHVHNASKSNWTIVIFNGHTEIDIPDNIHFFIFFGNVTFICFWKYKYTPLIIHKIFYFANYDDPPSHPLNSQNANIVKAV